MKKQFKIKLVLNSQTIRRLGAPGLKAVHGGRLADDSVEVCITDRCTGACPPPRACG